MKNIGLYLSIVALLGVVMLYVDRFSGKKEGSSSKTEQNVEFSGTENVAFVNIDSLVDSYDYYNELKASMMQKQTNLGNDLESRYKSLQRKAMELQQKVEQRLMTPTTAQNEQQKLMQQEQQIMADKQNLELQLAEENQNLTVQILDSVKNYLNIINKDQKYSLILSSNVIGGTVLTSAAGKDITSEVIKGLNDRFKNAKSSKTEKKDEKTK
jgi:outer membrane protein